MKVKISIKADILLKRIPEVQKELHEKIKKELINTALVDIESVAKMTLTTKGHVLTGRLRSSIHTEYYGKTSYSYKDNNGNGFEGGLSEKPKNDLSVFVGTNVVYARRMERLDAYLFPAYERSKPGLQARLRKIMNSL